VANDVTAQGAGFDVDTNIITMFFADGRDVTLPKLPKAELAQRILDELLRMRAAQEKNGLELAAGFHATRKEFSH
jgi:hypothetical protein